MQSDYFEMVEIGKIKELAVREKFGFNHGRPGAC